MIVFVDWDTDGFTLKELDLSNEVEIPDEIEEDEVSDYLSDEYGWCVNSWKYADY